MRYVVVVLGVVALFTRMTYAGEVLQFWASEDAWVNEVNPTVNYGSNSYVTVKDRSGLAEAYFKFSSEDLKQLSGKAIQSASLNLYQYQGTYSAGDEVNVRGLGGDWNEAGITWGNRPGILEGSLGSSLALTGGLNEWREWKGLESLVSYWAKGNNYGLVLENGLDGKNEELFARFYSSESAFTEFRPYLKVETSDAADNTVTPEPVSAALFILGAASLWGRSLRGHPVSLKSVDIFNFD